MTEQTPDHAARAERYVLLRKAGQEPDKAQALVELIDRQCAELEQLRAQREALAARLRAGQTWRRGRTPALVSEDYVSQRELRDLFGIPLTAPWEQTTAEPAEPAALPFNLLVSALEPSTEDQAAEVQRLRTELAEEKARHDPRLRGPLLKAARDQDMYVSWSFVADGPTGVWTRETALKEGYPPSYLDRADATGTSNNSGRGGWDDNGFVVEQRGWLVRELLGEYATASLNGDHQAADALLEPFDDELA